MKRDTQFDLTRIEGRFAEIEKAIIQIGEASAKATNDIRRRLDAIEEDNARLHGRIDGLAKRLDKKLADLQSDNKGISFDDAVNQGGDNHQWECIEAGEYDFIYQCEKCGNKFTESADSLETKPEGPCIGLHPPGGDNG